MRWPLILAAVVFTLLLPALASAHGMRTGYLEIVEIQSGHATVHLRLNTRDPSLTLRVSGQCSLVEAGDGASLYDKAWLLDCPAGLDDGWLELSGLGPIVSDAVAWTSFADGTTRSRILTPDAPRMMLARAASEGPLTVAREYMRLGIVHILTGYDHLLFLFLLTLLVRNWRGVLLAESAFTLSHSLSFSATALGWVRVSSLAAEACIALSLVLLAAEIDPRGPPAPKWRAAGLALIFGLVHGLGFAGGLREIGLPERSVGAALLAFGAGVEVGQVAFLALLLILLYAVRNVRVLPKAVFASVYAAGAVSMYWLIGRVWLCLGHA